MLRGPGGGSVALAHEDGETRLKIVPLGNVVIRGLMTLIALAGQFERPMPAQEQRVAELVFEHPDLLGNRAGRDVQLLRRLGQTVVTRGGLEGGKRVERGKPIEASDHGRHPVCCWANILSRALWISSREKLLSVIGIA